MDLNAIASTIVRMQASRGDDYHKPALIAMCPHRPDYKALYQDLNDRA